MDLFAWFGVIGVSVLSILGMLVRWWDSASPEKAATYLLKVGLSPAHSVGTRFVSLWCPNKGLCLAIKRGFGAQLLLCIPRREWAHDLGKPLSDCLPGKPPEDEAWLKRELYDAREFLAKLCSVNDNLPDVYNNDPAHWEYQKYTPVACVELANVKYGATVEFDCWVFWNDSAGLFEGSLRRALRGKDPCAEIRRGPIMPFSGKLKETRKCQ